MDIDADIDGGSIVVLNASPIGGASAVELALHPDNAASFMHWFHFRALGAEGAASTFRIVNAGESSYPGGWESYRACASYDGERWFRVPTEYDGRVLTFSHTPEREIISYACFAPYPLERQDELLAQAVSSPRARVERLGESLEGRPMSVVIIGDEDRAKLRIWIVARQHPGETMAEWFMEGVIPRLLDEADPVSAALLDRAVVYLVPNMNPDGGARGNHRTNAAGQDLNRTWLAPSLEQSPEVFVVRRALLDSGVDLFLDVHGDESYPYLFAAGCEGNPSYSERMNDIEELFTRNLDERHDGFQRRHGYDLDEPGKADLRLASNYVGERFDCLSLTLEMPFKDDADNPDEVVGWSPERAARFGGTTLETIVDCLDSLR